MIVLALFLMIALVVAFLVLDGRSRPERAEPTATERPGPVTAESPEPAVRTPEDVERDIYRELYAERSGEVSRRPLSTERPRGRGRAAGRSRRPRSAPSPQAGD